MVRPCGARGFLDLADAVLHQCIQPLIGARRAPCGSRAKPKPDEPNALVDEQNQEPTKDALLNADASLLRALERSRPGRAACAAAEPARSVLGRHRRLRAISWPQLSRGDASCARRQRGDFVGAHRVLTAAAAMAGPNDLAKAALRELRRVQPSISLAWIATEMPIKHDVGREHFLQALRRAGLDGLASHADKAHVPEAAHTRAYCYLHECHGRIGCTRKTALG
jgi:hypothetical protein